MTDKAAGEHEPPFDHNLGGEEVWRQRTKPALQAGASSISDSLPFCGSEVVGPPGLEPGLQV